MLTLLQEDHFRNMPDLTRLAKRFERRKAKLQEVVRLYDIVVKLPRWLEDLKALEADHADESFQQLLREKFIDKLEVGLCDDDDVIRSSTRIHLRTHSLTHARTHAVDRATSMIWSSSASLWRRPWIWTLSRITSTVSNPTLTRSFKVSFKKSHHIFRD